MPDTEPNPPVPMYDATYSNFAQRLYADIRAATHERDIGQNGWLTARELDRFTRQLGIGAGSRVLEVACGSGEPSLRIVEKTGCTLVGLDIHADGVAHANDLAARRGLTDRASFLVHDATRALPFEPRSFDAVLCIDAINHLPDRARVLESWFRALRPGGRLLYVDPIVVTGALTNAEIAARSSIGFFLFVPPGLNERLLGRAGFEGVESESLTESVKDIAARWRTARDVREHDLRAVEGDETFAEIQRFLKITATLAREGRLSRFAFLAQRPT